MGRAYFLTLQFDGTDYCGWQRQRDGQSVQGEVERVLARLTGTPITAVAAGRTDAGVHAAAMPVSVVVPAQWTADELLRALNALLPPTIAVRAVRAVRPDAHARRSAAGRRYRYDIGTDGSCRSPFRYRTEWPLGRPLSIGALERSASVLSGEHDFRAFAAVGEPKPHYRCRVHEAEWREIGPGRLRFTIAADRFLHHMVRFLVGTMVDVGLGRREEDDMARLLQRTDNHETSPPAPPSGLTFVAAWYPDDVWLDEAATW